MVGGIWGAIKGFIEEVSQKFGYVNGFIVATMFTIAFSKVFKEKFDFPQWFAAFLAYFILFMVGYLLIKGLGAILENIFETAKLTSLNNFLGFLLGFIEAIIVIGVLETVLSYQNLFNVSSLFEGSIISSSVILPVFKTILGWVQGLI